MKFVEVTLPSPSSICSSIPESISWPFGETFITISLSISPYKVALPLKYTVPLPLIFIKESSVPANWIVALFTISVLNSLIPVVINVTSASATLKLFGNKFVNVVFAGAVFDLTSFVITVLNTFEPEVTTKPVLYNVFP